MSTDTSKETIKTALDKANPQVLADLLRLIKKGTMMTPIKETITLASVSATIDLTVKSAAGLAADRIRTLRVSDVTGGTSARVGSYVVTDASGTPLDPQADSPGVCTLSDDGKTLTFAGTVKAIVITYYPVPYTALSTLFPTSG